LKDADMPTPASKTTRTKLKTTRPASKAVPRSAKKVAVVKPSKAAKTPVRRTTAVQKAAAIEKAAKKATAAGRNSARTVLRQTRNASFKLLDSQRAIWLAGLGALAKANAATGNRGEQAFEALVQAGATLESQANQAIENHIERIKTGITGATDAIDQGIERVGTSIDALVEQALDRVGFPKVNTLNDLMERLTELSKTLETKIRTTFKP
jgi:poly(hydroxyalkanoate) granule-associated protein